MTRVRAAVAAVALLLGLAPAAVSAAGRPSLAGTNVLTATRSASMAVRLARPATIRDPLLADGAANDVVVTTRGRFAAFALVQEGVRERDQLVFVGGNVPGAGSAAYVYGANGVAGGASWRLPAGNYTLHVVTDGAHSAVIRLRLLGLTGSTRLAPRTANGAAAALPKASVDPDPARLTYVAGAERKVGRRTVFFSVLYAAYAAHVDTLYNSCFYFERPEGPAPYAPGCPDTASRHVTPISLPPDAATPAKHVILSSFLPLRDGHFAAGASFVTVTPATQVRYLQLWLPY